MLIGVVVEDGNVVGALAPLHFLLFVVRCARFGQGLGVLLEPNTGFFTELVDIGKVCHALDASSAPFPVRHRSLKFVPDRETR